MTNIKKSKYINVKNIKNIRNGSRLIILIESLL